MQTEKFTRKPFPIDAVQVTNENMAAVAKWCQGEVLTTDPKIAEQLGHPEEGGKPYISVKVRNPMNDRQTQAFDRDWVVYAGKGYMVYTNKAFRRSFEPVFKTPVPTAPNQPVPLVDVTDEDGHTTVTLNRSAESGQFVTEAEVLEHPETTVTETIVVEPSGQAVVEASPEDSGSVDLPQDADLS